MSLLDFTRFFRPEEDRAEESRLATWTEALDWASQAYHNRFMEWLEEEANKPIPVSENHMETVKAAVRANTLKEIRKHLQRVVREAEAGLRAAREESDGR